ncbi:MAG: FtsX-like permease family protein [Anaerolineaceae bacterium]|nr:FtsX-like permease family protein [Anaerolineaceae bacterium]
MNLQFTLAKRYLSGRKLRTLLTTLAVIFGVVVIFGMNIILPTMIEAFQANVTAASGEVDLTLTHRSGGAFPKNIINRLDTIEGIRAISPVLDRTINLPADFVDKDPNTQDRITAISLIGIEIDKSRALKVYPILEGGRLLDSGDTNAAMISQTLANIWKIGLNEDISIPSINGVVSLTVVGLLPPKTAPGNEQIILPLSQAQIITGSEDQINSIEIALNSIDDSERLAVTDQIQEKIGSAYQIGSLDAGSELLAGIKLGQAAFNVFGVLALFMGGFIIYNTFRTIIAERRRDIGMLRALGANRKTIIGMVLVEGLIQGILGSVIGIVLGYLFGALVIRLAEAPLNTFIHLSMGKPVVSPLIIIVTLVLGILTTILAGLIPALRASKVSPMDALRPSVAEVEYRKASKPRFMIGIILVILALIALFTNNMILVFVGNVLFLLGIILVAPVLLQPISAILAKIIALFSKQGTSSLSKGNLTRQSSRVVITTSTSMIAFAIIVALGGMITSLMGMMNGMIRQNLGSDYLFIPPSVSLWSSDIGSGQEFTDRLQSLDGVGEISTLRFAGSSINDQSVSLLGINPETFPNVSGLDFRVGDETAFGLLSDSRSLIVNGSFGMMIGAKTGDSVDLITANGVQTYTIVAEGNDLLNAKVTTAYMSQEFMARDFNVTEDVFIQLNLAPGTRPENVEPLIKGVAADYPQYTVVSGNVYIGQMMDLINIAFVGMYFMLAFLAVPSLIAMVNTLAISVIERKREIGMLRALGATRKQVSRMITVEALLLSSVGTLFGIIAGVYLGYMLVKALAVMFPVVYVFPFIGIFIAILVGITFGALAAIIPARQASRLQVIEALRYE